MNMCDGVLICNLGSPDSPAVTDVRRYLREFLMDPWVLQIPRPLRWILVNLVILPLRPARTAEAYAKIWTRAGSPLMMHSQNLASALAEALDLPVAVAMRYGSPSIEAGFESLSQAGARRVLLVPMYPQFADSTTTTCMELALEEARHRHIDISILPPFYAQPQWLDAVADSCRRVLPPNLDCLLLSFHGLPEAHIKRADMTGSTCLATPECCDHPGAAASTCYRHQCHVSRAEIARRLELSDAQCRIAFQSRLGPTRWLAPNTEEVLESLPSEGIRHLAVACPGFSADNLETIEEIGIRGREIFLAAGGESFQLVPCLNDAQHWVRALASLCRDAAVWSRDDVDDVTPRLRA